MKSTSASPLGLKLDIADVLENSPPELDFVLPGLPAGAVGMLAGSGGVGKTMFELQLAVVLAAGLPWRLAPLSALLEFDEERSPERVLLLLAEESIAVVWRRLHAVVAHIVRCGLFDCGLTAADVKARLAENFVIHALAGSRRLQLLDDTLEAGEHYPALRAAADGARLVIVDPIRQLHVANENESGAMSALVSVLKRLAHDTGAAVVFAHHASRAAGQFGFSESADASRGSTALVDDTRWVVTLSEPSRDRLKSFGVADGQPEGFAVLSAAKMNYIARPAAALLSREPSGVLCAHERVPKAERMPTRSRQ